MRAGEKKNTIGEQIKVSQVPSAMATFWKRLPQISIFEFSLSFVCLTKYIIHLVNPMMCCRGGDRGGIFHEYEMLPTGHVPDYTNRDLMLK